MTPQRLGFTQRLSVGIHCLIGLLLCTSLSAHSQTYPSKPIRVIVPWPAGGLVDVAARQLSNRLQTSMGQAIVVDNKLGAGGNVGAEAHDVPVTTNDYCYNTAAENRKLVMMQRMPVKWFFREQKQRQ